MQKTQKDEQPAVNSSSAQGGLQAWQSSLKIQTYCDASFAPGGGRSRSGIFVLLVDEISNRATLLLWQSLRQTLTALSAPEAEVVSLSEALMPAVVIVKTDIQVTLTQLRNESVNTRSRPFANKFSYARGMCHGTSVHPAAVKAVLKAKRLTVSQKYLLVHP